MFAVIYSFNSISFFILKLFNINFFNTTNNNNTTINPNTKKFKNIYSILSIDGVNFKEKSTFIFIIIENFFFYNFLSFFLINKHELAKKNMNLFQNNLNCKYTSNEPSLSIYCFKLLENFKSNKVNQHFKANNFNSSISNFLSKIISSKLAYLSSNYIIKFSVSDFFKNLNGKTLNYMNILFLRKNKVFNKGRYSRNRQYYRTGVYWCLYINIIAVIGIYFWFYRFNMNFGYLWWLLYIFICSFAFSRALSYNLLNLKNLFLQILNSIFWFLNIISTLINNLFLKLKIFFKTLANYI